MRGVLARHNVHRCMHSAPPLRWSSALEADAKQWAAMGRGQRSPPFLLQNVAGFAQVGENTGVDYPDPGGDRSPSGAVTHWYDQVTQTRRGAVDHFDRRWSAYTQVVWRSTTHVGCGWHHGFIVCHYGLGGNVDGQYSSQVNERQKSQSECMR
mmetsp:Transcript_45343/g.117380  ORF Transcript_45343/g.117380 Transcript_45343/m.117380 type:complete len:153 (+) Transcript_45343:233-691(+)